MFHLHFARYAIFPLVAFETLFQIWMQMNSRYMCLSDHSVKDNSSKTVRKMLTTVVYTKIKPANWIGGICPIWIHNLINMNITRERHVVGSFIHSVVWGRIDSMWNIKRLHLQLNSICRAFSGPICLRGISHSSTGQRALDPMIFSLGSRSPFCHVCRYIYHNTNSPFSFNWSKY